MWSCICFVGLAGMIVLYHSPSSFRFTISVSVLGVLLLYFQQLPLITTAVLSGCAILLIRSITYLFVDFDGALTFFITNYSTIIYYFAYGICFRALRIRCFVSHILRLLLLLSVVDILSNFSQIWFRVYPLPHDYQLVISSMIGAAVLRSILIVIGYYALRKYRDFVLAAEQLAHYHQLTIIISQLKAEVYYLKKSSHDIEMVMEKSYILYKDLQDQNPQNPTSNSGNAQKAAQALTIARCIHEIKKDYYRVINGIDNAIKPSTQETSLLLSEVFRIIEENMNRFLETAHKKIQVVFELTADFPTNQHYSIVSILNNLIINAVEACSAGGLIRVQQRMENGSVIFIVEDNGSGINKRDFPLLFSPGYSTKFCEVSGKMSTGLGLVHISNLTQMLGGTIAFDSNPGELTWFKITLPLRNVMAEKSMSGG